MKLGISEDQVTSPIQIHWTVSNYTTLHVVICPHLLLLYFHFHEEASAAISMSYIRLPKLFPETDIAYNLC